MTFSVSMRRIDMRKLLVILMTLALLMNVPTAFAEKNTEDLKNMGSDLLAEPNSVYEMNEIESFAEKSNEGTVNVIDDWMIGRDSVSRELETEPFVPKDMDIAELGITEEFGSDAIFGNDGRVTVTWPSVYPYSTIAYMRVIGRCGDSWSGTGFMVGRDRLLTAAHVLVCPEHNAWAKNIDFYFGYKSDNDCRYHYRGKWTAWAGNVFKDHRYSIINDFGCVKLYQNVGDMVGWLGSYWGQTSSFLESNYMQVAGYRSGILRYDTGWVTAYDSSHLTYTIDTVCGNSGGPIFTSKYYAVGINIAFNSNFNIGYRLTSTVKSRLNNLD